MSEALSVKTKILKAALREFGIEGYKNASTNRISKSAGVSKGSIFKIFSSKAKLYLSVFSMALDEMVAEREGIEFAEGDDAFQKIMVITHWKIEYAARHQYETKVMLEAVSDPPDQIQRDIEAAMDKLKQLSLDSIFADISMDGISNKYSRSDVIRYIDVGLAGIQAKYLTRPLTVEYMASIRDDCIDFLKIILKGMEE